MEFHGIPWNFYSRCGDSMEFHGIPWNLVLASSSMELSKFHGIPLNFHFDVEKFHGFPWNSMELLASSMEFRGIPWNCEILILINFITGEVYFIVCYMISCNCISDNPLVVEILRYFNSKAIYIIYFDELENTLFYIYIYMSFKLQYCRDYTKIRNKRMIRCKSYFNTEHILDKCMRLLAVCLKNIHYIWKRKCVNFLLSHRGVFVIMWLRA